jgi:hypothetical protein
MTPVTADSAAAALRSARANAFSFLVIRKLDFGDGKKNQKEIAQCFCFGLPCCDFTSRGK